MHLEDIAVPHRYTGSKPCANRDFVLHPFKATRGSGAGRFEIICDVKQGSAKPCKKTSHVTAEQLAELLVRGLLDTHNIRVRVKSVARNYPTQPPGLHLRPQHVVGGSRFANLMAAVDVGRALTPGLLAALEPFGLPDLATYQFESGPTRAAVRARGADTTAA